MKRDEIKDQALKSMALGLSISATSRKYKVSRATLYAWQKQQDDKGRKGASVAGPVTMAATKSLVPKESETVASLIARVKELENQYEQLLQVSQEEISDLQESLEFTLKCLKESMTRKLKPKETATNTL